MVRKKKKKLPVVPLCVAAILVVAGIVFAVFALSNGGAHSEGLRQEVQAISEWRRGVTDFLELKVESAKLTEEEKGVVAKFESIFAEKKVENLQQLSVGENEKIKSLVGEVAESYKNVQDLYAIEQDVSVMFDGELSDDDLAALGKSENEFLRGMADDLKGYRAEVKVLSAKDDDFDKQYEALAEKGEGLKKKYADVGLEDLLGKKKEEVLAFFDKIDELNKYLQEY